jgi:hypothetical protein
VFAVALAVSIKQYLTSWYLSFHSLNRFTPVRPACIMQLFRAAEQHTRNVILAQDSHSADPTGEAGETQPAFVRLFSQFFHECLTATAWSAAVYASHQCTEHYVIGVQPPLGPGNQALRNEVSNSRVVGGQQVSNAIGDGIEIQEFEMQGPAAGAEDVSHSASVGFLFVLEMIVS